MKPQYLPKTMELFCKENQKSVVACDWYMNKTCPGTCDYAKKIIGIGASDIGTAKRIRNNLDKLMKEDMEDY